MKKKLSWSTSVFLFSLLAGLLFLSGCTNPAITVPGGNPFIGTWEYYGVAGTDRVAMRFDFLANGTGRFDLVAPDLDPPFVKSMTFSWESGGDRLWMGSSSEKQHLDIRYDPSSDLLKVTADSESGIFIGENFVPGPFSWEFSRAREET